MASKRIGILAGGALAGALLLGTAGLALAQDPTPPMGGGSGMMGGGSGMMGGGSGMMGGGSGMMGGGSGMMGSGSGMDPGNMTADQLEQMGKLHDQMVESGTCDPAQMQQLHDQIQSSN